MKFLKYLIFFLFLFLSKNVLAAYTCGIGADVVLQTNMNDYPSTICASLGGNNCLVQETHSEKTSNGWTVYAKSTGDACGSLTVLNRPTLPDDDCIRDPDGSIRCPEKPTEPEPDPILNCTSDSCANPDNKRCPSGYTSGSFNGQRLCMKSDNPDPDPDNPDKPTDSEEVNAIINAKNSIVSAIQDLSKSLSDSLKQFTDSIKESITNSNSGGNNTGGNNTGGNNTGEGEGEDGNGVDTSGLDATLPIKPVPPKDFQQNMFATSAQCPADKSLSMSFFGRSFSYSFSFNTLCGGLKTIGFFILIMCYLYASHIVIRA